MNIHAFRCRDRRGSEAGAVQAQGDRGQPWHREGQGTAWGRGRRGPHGQKDLFVKDIWVLGFFF